MQHFPSLHADLLLQNSSGAELHAAAGPAALGRQHDSNSGFQPQIVGDEELVWFFALALSIAAEFCGVIFLSGKYK